MPFAIGGTMGLSNTEETLRKNRWRIEKLGPVTPEILVFAESIDLPKVSIEEQQIKSAFLTYKFAKNVNWEDININFYDVSDLYSELEKWKSKIYTNDAGVRSPNDYKDDTILVLLDGKAGDVIKYTLKGSWIKSLGHTNLTYSSSEIKLINLTLSYDFALVK